MTRNQVRDNVAALPGGLAQIHYPLYDGYCDEYTEDCHVQKRGQDVYPFSPGTQADVIAIFDAVCKALNAE